MKKLAFVIAMVSLFTFANAQTTPQKNKGHKTQAADPKAQQKMDAASGGSMHSGGKPTDTGRGEGSGQSTSGSDNTGQNNSNQGGSNQAGSNQSGSNQSGSNQSGSNQSGSNSAGTKQGQPK